MNYKGFVIILVLILTTGCNQSNNNKTTEILSNQLPSAVYIDKPVDGKLIDCGFPPGDSQYHAMIQASDGNVYYAIGTHHRDTHVHMFCYSPSAGTVKLIADIGEVLGEDGTNIIPQGKIHCDFFEKDSELYFATHVGFFRRGGTEDHGPYPGGHFMKYTIASGEFTDLGIGVPEEGIVTMNMDKERGRLYCFSYPSGRFLYYDIVTGVKKVYSPIKFRNEPRSLGIDPRDGNVYWCKRDTIYRYNYDRDLIQSLPHNLDKPILKVSRKGKPQYPVTWRSIRWNKTYQKFYGVTFLGEYLFSYEPHTGEIEIIDRIAAGPNRKSGELAPISSLAFELSDNGTTIYYIGSVKKTEESVFDKCHLVTYSIPLRTYIDHGPIQLKDGRIPNYIQSMEIGRDGNIYLGSEIQVDDFSSDKWKTIHDIKITYMKPEKIKNAVDENNLIVVKNPL